MNEKVLIDELEDLYREFHSDYNKHRRAALDLEEDTNPIVPDLVASYHRSLANLRGAMSGLFSVAERMGLYEEFVKRTRDLEI